MCKYNGVFIPLFLRFRLISFTFSANSFIGCTAPTSLLAYITEIKTVLSVIISTNFATSTLPLESTGAILALYFKAGFNTASCSTALTISSASLSKLSITPCIAKFADSLPPAVKIISLGLAPIFCPTDARADSKTALTSLAPVYSAEGL